MTAQDVRHPAVTIAPDAARASQADIDAVSAAALDYIEGFAQGDPDRHGSAYHPECIKRRFVPNAETGVDELHVLSQRIMTDYAAGVGSTYADCEFTIAIDDISEGMASVRIYSCAWVDFLHVVEARGAWRLFHVTWRPRDEG